MRPFKKKEKKDCKSKRMSSHEFQTKRTEKNKVKKKKSR